MHQWTNGFRLQQENQQQHSFLQHKILQKHSSPSIHCDTRINLYLLINVKWIGQIEID